MKVYKVYNFTFITVLSMFVGVWAEVAAYTRKRWFTFTGAVPTDAIKTLRTDTWQINTRASSHDRSEYIFVYLQSLYHNTGAGNPQCTVYSLAHRNHCNTVASENKISHVSQTSVFIQIIGYKLSALVPARFQWHWFRKHFCYLFSPNRVLKKS